MAQQKTFSLTEEQGLLINMRVSFKNIPKMVKEARKASPVSKAKAKKNPVIFEGHNVILKLEELLKIFKINTVLLKEIRKEEAILHVWLNVIESNDSTDDNSVHNFVKHELSKIWGHIRVWDNGNFVSAQLIDGGVKKPPSHNLSFELKKLPAVQKIQQAGAFQLTPEMIKAREEAQSRKKTQGRKVKKQTKKGGKKKKSA